MFSSASWLPVTIQNRPAFFLGEEAVIVVIVITIIIIIIIITIIRIPIITILPHKLSNTTTTSSGDLLKNTFCNDPELSTASRALLFVVIDA